MPLSFTVTLRTLSALFLSSVLLVACEEPVDLDLPDRKSRLVLSSSFLPEQAVVLQVSATRPRGTPSGMHITDARVSLFEGMDLAEELTYFPSTETDRPGTYRTTTFKPQIGRQYTIHVYAPGYDPVSAVSSIPEPVGISSVTVEGLSVSHEEAASVYDYRLLVDYADPEAETNYYDLRISQMVVPFKLGSSGDTIRMQPYLKGLTTPIHEAAGGQTISILLQDKAGGPLVDVHLQSRLDPATELLGQVIAELRTVSPEYYFYQRSIMRPDEMPNSGLKDPVVIYNNVSSGLGVFAGYTSVQKGLTLPGPGN
ncbi:uncharacterized protein DUF4249 [Neolewinella xylanilytica]|uniref:Uncharacterized protein DUF4249 n=1 Tax=Neolewinella xylanilytica TaxID=1514080 RepID=A0A2S6I5G2_9BACT|nr:DUF4249 domain-containing protein [Neolewinella xylanilytica]PPK86390.1 uncharacterized protein DUF4249 [Neolewinella xylanilytica]